MSTIIDGGSAAADSALPYGSASLVSLDVALAWLGLETDDANGTIARLCSAVSAQIEQFISRNIISTAYISTFNGRGGNILMVPYYPITAVSKVTISGMSIPARLDSSPGYVFSEKSVMVDPPYSFLRGFQNISISYTAGYVVTPPDIERACLDWVKLSHEMRTDRPGNVSMLRAGDTEMRFEADVTRLDRGVIPMPPTIFALLQPYSRVFPA